MAEAERETAPIMGPLGEVVPVLGLLGDVVGF